MCQRDEIGRHEGFKIPCPQGRAGSSPAAGTILQEQCVQELLEPLRYVPHKGIILLLLALLSLLIVTRTTIHAFISKNSIEQSTHLYR